MVDFAGSQTVRHGLANKSKEYHTWKALRGRCLNKNNKRYDDYGGRGIKICDRWLTSYENFISDMGVAPSKNHTIERTDNDGNYDPGNCRWATRYEQSLNKRSNIRITNNGITLTLSEWASKFNVNYSTARVRFHQNLPFDLIFKEC